MPYATIGDFSWALLRLKDGTKVARHGWNGKGMWLTLMKIYTHTKIQYDESNAFNLQPFIAMKTVDGTLVPWLASQTDMLADDWEEVE